MDVKPSTLSVDRARVLACRTSDCQQSYGHNLFISLQPADSDYRRGLNIDQLMRHLNEAVPLFEVVKGQVADTYVDESKKSVVVRSSIFLTPKGSNEVVENDIAWFLVMDELGKKVRKAMEFMDSAAPVRLEELFESVKA